MRSGGGRHPQSHHQLVEAAVPGRRLAAGARGRESAQRRVFERLREMADGVAHARPSSASASGPRRPGCSTARRDSSSSSSKAVQAAAGRAATMPAKPLRPGQAADHRGAAAERDHRDPVRRCTAAARPARLRANPAARPRREPGPARPERMANRSSVDLPSGVTGTGLVVEADVAVSDDRGQPPRRRRRGGGPGSAPGHRWWAGAGVSRLTPSPSRRSWRRPSGSGVACAGSPQPDHESSARSPGGREAGMRAPYPVGDRGGVSPPGVGVRASCATGERPA